MYVLLVLDILISLLSLACHLLHINQCKNTCPYLEQHLIFYPNPLVFFHQPHDEVDAAAGKKTFPSYALSPEHDAMIKYKCNIGFNL